MMRFSMGALGAPYTLRGLFLTACVTRSCDREPVKESACGFSDFLQARPTLPNLDSPLVSAG